MICHARYFYWADNFCDGPILDSHRIGNTIRKWPDGKLGINLQPPSIANSGASVKMRLPLPTVAAISVASECICTGMYCEGRITAGNSLSGLGFKASDNKITAAAASLTRLLLAMVHSPASGYAMLMIRNGIGMAKYCSQLVGVINAMKKNAIAITAANARGWPAVLSASLRWIKALSQRHTPSERL